jgi:hypothetical protein
MSDRRRRRKTDAAAHRMFRGINDRPINLGEPRRPQWRRPLQPRARQLHTKVAQPGCCPLGVSGVAWGAAFVYGRAQWPF